MLFARCDAFSSVRGRLSPRLHVVGHVVGEGGGLLVY
jgi:hypothetical protein